MVMIFSRRRGKTDKDKSSSGMNPNELIAQFEKEIARQENLLYGMALFFEGISILYAGQTAMIETSRKQFRNSILTGKNKLQQAVALLTQVKEDPGEAPLIDQFRFSLCDDHPEPDKMLRRSEVLAETYDCLFPGRPRSQPFADDETLLLIETASEEMGKIENEPHDTIE